MRVVQLCGLCLPDIFQRVGRINDLDMKHQSNIHQIDLVNKDEEGRRLKLRVLALRDDNATLKDQVVQRDARLRSLQRQGIDVRVELDEAKETTKLQELRLQKQAKELADLKVQAEIVAAEPFANLLTEL